MFQHQLLRLADIKFGLGALPELFLDRLWIRGDGIPSGVWDLEVKTGLQCNRHSEVAGD